MAASVACASAALLVWFGLRLGPVLLVVSHKEDHAIHLGDVLVGAPLAIAAVVVAFRCATGTRRRH